MRTLVNPSLTGLSTATGGSSSALAQAASRVVSSAGTAGHAAAREAFDNIALDIADRMVQAGHLSEEQIPEFVEGLFRKAQTELSNQASQDRQANPAKQDIETQPIPTAAYGGAEAGGAPQANRNAAGLSITDVPGLLSEFQRFKRGGRYETTPEGLSIAELDAAPGVSGSTANVSTEGRLVKNQNGEWVRLPGSPGLEGGGQPPSSPEGPGATGGDTRRLMEQQRFEDNLGQWSMNIFGAPDELEGLRRLSSWYRQFQPTSEAGAQKFNVDSGQEVDFSQRDKQSIAGQEARPLSALPNSPEDIVAAIINEENSMTSSTMEDSVIESSRRSGGGQAVSPLAQLYRSDPERMFAGLQPEGVVGEIFRPGDPRSRFATDRPVLRRQEPTGRSMTPSLTGGEGAGYDAPTTEVTDLAENFSIFSPEEEMSAVAASMGVRLKGNKAGGQTVAKQAAVEGRLPQTVGGRDKGTPRPEGNQVQQALGGRFGRRGSITSVKRKGAKQRVTPMSMETIGQRGSILQNVDPYSGVDDPELLQALGQYINRLFETRVPGVEPPLSGTPSGQEIKEAMLLYSQQWDSPDVAFEILKNNLNNIAAQGKDTWSAVVGRKRLVQGTSGLNDYIVGDVVIPAERVEALQQVMQEMNALRAEAGGAPTADQVEAGRVLYREYEALKGPDSKLPNERVGFDSGSPIDIDGNLEGGEINVVDAGVPQGDRPPSPVNPDTQGSFGPSGTRTDGPNKSFGRVITSGPNAGVIETAPGLENVTGTGNVREKVALTKDERDQRTVDLDARREANQARAEAGVAGSTNVSATGEEIGAGGQVQVPLHPTSGTAEAAAEAAGVAEEVKEVLARVLARRLASDGNLTDRQVWDKYSTPNEKALVDDLEKYMATQATGVPAGGNPADNPYRLADLPEGITNPEQRFVREQAPTQGDVPGTAAGTGEEVARAGETGPPTASELQSIDPKAQKLLEGISSLSQYGGNPMWLDVEDAVLSAANQLRAQDALTTARDREGLTPANIASIAEKYGIGGFGKDEKPLVLGLNVPELSTLNDIKLTPGWKDDQALGGPLREGGTIVAEGEGVKRFDPAIEPYTELEEVPKSLILRLLSEDIKLPLDEQTLAPLLTRAVAGSGARNMEPAFEAEPVAETERIARQPDDPQSGPVTNVTDEYRYDDSEEGWGQIPDDVQDQTLLREERYAEEKEIRRQEMQGTEQGVDPELQQYGDRLIEEADKAAASGQSVEDFLANSASRAEPSAIASSRRRMEELGGVNDPTNVDSQSIGEVTGGPLGFLAETGSGLSSYGPPRIDSIRKNEEDLAFVSPAADDQTRMRPPPIEGVEQSFQQPTAVELLELQDALNAGTVTPSEFAAAGGYRGKEVPSVTPEEMGREATTKARQVQDLVGREGMVTAEGSEDVARFLTGPFADAAREVIEGYRKAGASISGPDAMLLGKAMKESQTQTSPNGSRRVLQLLKRFGAPLSVVASLLGSEAAKAYLDDMYEGGGMSMQATGSYQPGMS